MGKLLRAGLLGAAALAIPAGINLLIARQRRELLNTLPGDGGEYQWPFGNIYYQYGGKALQSC